MRRPPGRKYLLAPMERVYVIDAANGLTMQQSADAHRVSVNTVKTTLLRARAELGARNIAHAVALAILHGEITARNLKGTQS